MGAQLQKLGVHEGLAETQQKGNEEQARLARERVIKNICLTLKNYKRWAWATLK